MCRCFRNPEHNANQTACRRTRTPPFLGMERRQNFYQASTSEMFGLVQEIPQKKRLHFIHARRAGVANCTAIDHGELSWRYNMFAINAFYPNRPKHNVLKTHDRCSAISIRPGLLLLFLGTLMQREIGSQRISWGYGNDVTWKAWRFCFSTGITVSQRDFRWRRYSNLTASNRILREGINESYGSKCTIPVINFTEGQQVIGINR